MTNPPKIIYKYRDWNNLIHRNVLLNQELYISSPKDFNDPFDCRITKNFDLLDTDEKIWEFVKYQSNNLRQQLLKNGENIPAFEQRVFNRLKFDKEKEQKDWNDYTFRKQDEHYGVLSFSEIWDSILMWGHYAYNHSGFCVGFYEQKLQESGQFGGGGPVLYGDAYPSIDPLDETSMKSLFIETHSKASDWKYEKEYRLVKLFYPNTPTNDERIIHVDKSCFAEIIIGLKFPKADISWISDLAYKLGVKLYEIKHIPYKFKLIKEELV